MCRSAIQTVILLVILLSCLFLELDTSPISRIEQKLENIDHPVDDNCYPVDDNGFVNFENKQLTAIPPICEPWKAIHLQLSGNSIETLDSSSLSQLANLETADFSFNRITHIDKDTFSGLTRLRQLNLSNNELEEFHHNLIKYNTRLKKLLLSRNRILSIHLFSRSLEFLGLGYNKGLTVSPESFRYLPALEELDLSFCNLKQISQDPFKQNPMLRSLYINGNSLPCNSGYLNNFFIYEPFRSGKEKAIRCLMPNGHEHKLMPINLPDISSNELSDKVSVTNQIPAQSETALSSTPHIFNNNQTNILTEKKTVENATSEKPFTGSDIPNHKIEADDEDILRKSSWATPFRVIAVFLMLLLVTMVLSFLVKFCKKDVANGRVECHGDSRSCSHGDSRVECQCGSRITLLSQNHL